MLLGVENDRSRNHGAGQRPTPRLVNTRDEPVELKQSCLLH